MKHRMTIDKAADILGRMKVDSYLGITLDELEAIMFAYECLKKQVEIKNRRDEYYDAPVRTMSYKEYLILNDCVLEYELTDEHIEDDETKASEGSGHINATDLLPIVIDYYNKGKSDAFEQMSELLKEAEDKINAIRKM